MYGIWDTIKKNKVYEKTITLSIWKPRKTNRHQINSENSENRDFKGAFKNYFA